jgi:hypothetical protein
MQALVSAMGRNDLTPRKLRAAIRCSAMMTVVIVASIVIAWMCPRYAFGYPDDVVAAALGALGNFAMLISLANGVLASAVFWRAPEMRSWWLNAAIVMPAAVVLLCPAIQA